MNVIAPVPDAGEIMESVIVKGDIAKLSPHERSRYYVEVCKSLGLNPLTKPFEYIVLNGKMVLYALRNCTEQLRKIHGVQVTEMKSDKIGDVYVVTVKVMDKHGRADMATGAVTVGNLKGDALANAMMKAETKAKRRATLSICGLGFLDETELETIPGATRRENGNGHSSVSPIKPKIVAAPHHPETGEVSPHAIPGDLSSFGGARAWGQLFVTAIKASVDADELFAWESENAAALQEISESQPTVYTRLKANLEETAKRLVPAMSEPSYADETDDVGVA